MKSRLRISLGCFFEFKDYLAWSYKEMVGLASKVVVHKLERLEIELKNIQLSLTNFLATSSPDAIELYGDCGITTSDSTNAHCASTISLFGIDDR